MRLLTTLDPSSGPMRTEAVAAGFYAAPDFGRDVQRVQIATVEELMGGVQPQIPVGQTTVARKGRARRVSGQQGLDLAW